MGRTKRGTRHAARQSTDPRATDPRVAVKRRFPRWWAALLLLGGLLAAAAILRQPNSDSATPVTGSGPLDPRQLLTEVLGQYQAMSSYVEAVDIRLQLPADGRLVEEVTRVEQAIQLPNQFHVRVRRGEQQVEVASDGELLRAVVTDPDTDNFDNQYVERPAPRELSAATLYSATEYADVGRPNELLSLLMDFPLDFQISPMGLLLGPQPWEQMLADATEITLQPPRELGGETCHGVRVATPAGEFVFWVTAQQRRIRRIEYPVARLLHPDTPIELRTRASLISNHGQLRVDQALPADVFTVQAEREGAKMRHFVLPFREDPPVALRRQPEPFRLQGLDDLPVESTTWDDQVAVLLWFNDHPASQAVAVQLDQVRQQLPDEAPIVILGVCSDPATEKSHQDVRNIARRWQVGMPIVRDTQAVGRDLFDIQQAPTLVVINREGIVQLIEVGANPQLEQQLPAVLDRVLAGDDVAAEYLRFVEQQQLLHEQLKASAGWDAPTQELQLTETVIAPRSVPQSFRLERAWQHRDIDQPGNILAVPSALHEYHLIVNSGWDGIVVLTPTGEQSQRRQLDVDDGLVMSQLRTGQDEKGRRYYVGLAAMTRQVHLFDERWQHVLTYPPSDQNHPGIQDAWLGDLDRDGNIELYVGFAGVVGLHCVDRQGQRRWTNRSTAPVLSLAEVTSGAERYLLVTGTGGQIDRIDGLGRKQSPIMVGTRAIHHVFPSRATTVRPTQLCGLAYLPNGQLIAVGLTPAATEAWNYPLPPGNFGNQLRFVTSGQVFADGAWDWLIAGPDGSIHIVSDDGQRHDAFHYGKQLAGLAAVRVDGRSLLVVSTDAGVDGWWLVPHDEETD